MGTLIVVDGDKVEGTDKHAVSGQATNPASPPGPPTIAYLGVADFEYKGKITEALSDFVKIDGIAVAVLDSKSSLNPGEDAPPGKHSGPQGSNFLPPAPAPILSTINIDNPVGEGVPSATAGSSFVKISDSAVLLDGDSIDTCDDMSVPMNSTVTAENQDFVSCSE